jgi:colanic acid/amylovoran biosynthesis glycosyltransferase
LSGRVTLAFEAGRVLLLRETVAPSPPEIAAAAPLTRPGKSEATMATSVPPTTIAYLINQYPRVSHSFIRREISALEQAGFAVARYSVRRAAEALVDPADQAEQARTRILLEAGPLVLLLAVLRTVLGRPRRFLRALGLTLAIGRRADRGWIAHAAYLAQACLLREWLAAASVVHLHAHFATNPAAVAMLCRVLGGPPYSFTVHGPHEFDSPAFHAMTVKIERAAFVAAVSSFGRSQLYRWCSHRHWPKIQVVRCGVDRSYLAEAPSPVPDSVRLVCVGRLCEQKGQLLLVQALGRLAAAQVPCELVLVGDGELRDQIESLAADLAVTDRLTITGWATGDEVRRQLLAARALVLPSFAEGLPVVIMEALALGRPVISTYIAGIPELVEPGGCGWLVPAGSVSRLVDAMREVLAAPVDVLSDMGRAGRERVARHHDAHAEAARLAALFRHVDAGSG